MKHVIIGTAGHVDHGKTWLTKALTGTNTDRLKEEQERGITIDIGFAQLMLPNNQSASIIDVPGHEGLVRNMIVGATGMDLVLLVVAADEGFMPQTQEHLEILQLLGVETGIVVLTKCDAVDGEWLEVVEADVRDHVEGTFLEGAPIARVSALTGEGIDDLRQLIAQMVEHAVPKNTERAYRLPIDRSFSKKGFGTVVTGTLVDGTLRVGDKLEVYPTHVMTRVRDLQNHNESAREMYAGMRVAANLTGVERSDVRRGRIIAQPGTVEVTRRVTVQLQLTSDAPFSVKNSSSLHFFTGTQEVVGRVRLLETDEMQPGGTGFAQLSFDEDVSARNHDRFIVRFFSPMVTVGGGSILDMASGRLKRNNEDVIARLRSLAGSATQRVEQRVIDARLAPLPRQALSVMENLSAAETDQVLSPLLDEGRILAVGEGLISAVWFDRLRDNVLDVLRGYHAAHTLERGIRLGELRERAFSSCPESADALIARFRDEGLIEMGGGCVWLAGFAPSFSAEQSRLYERVKAAFDETGYEARGNDEVRVALGVDAQPFAEVFARLLADGAIVAVTSDSSVGGDAYRRALQTFRSMFESDDRVTIAQFRDRLGISRKFAQLLLDSFDNARISKLVGDARVLLGS